MANKAKLSIPMSATSYGINLTGLLVYMLSIRILRIAEVPKFWGTVISLLAIVATIAILERIKMGNKLNFRSKLDFKMKREVDKKRVLIKLFGLYGTIALVAFSYWLIPFYRGSYPEYFRLILMLLPIIVFGSVPYFFIMDKYMKEPCDGHWHFGMLLLGKGKEIDKFILKNHLLGWVVKGFFLPLMVPGLINNTGIMFEKSFKESLEHYTYFWDYMYNFIFSIDLAFVTIGYLLTLKIFDSHIRTVEPSIFGWLVALQCYQPFWNFMGNDIFRYEDNYYWGHMLGSVLPVYKAYGIVILTLLAIYTLASVSFGLRFSNLTNRGIITNGPFRWMKHPAYVSKNLAWWLMSVPFISSAGWQTAVQHSLLLLGLNIVYYLRAITEERHLSLDPTYVQYAKAMNEKGIFRGLFKRFPFLRYDVNRYIEDGQFKKLLF